MFITVEKHKNEEDEDEYIVNHFDSEGQALVFYESQMNFFEKKPDIILAEVVEIEMKAVRKPKF